MARCSKSTNLKMFMDILCSLEGISSVNEKMQLLSRMATILLEEKEKQPVAKGRGRPTKQKSSELPQ